MHAFWTMSILKVPRSRIIARALRRAINDRLQNHSKLHGRGPCRYGTAHTRPTEPRADVALRKLRTLFMTQARLADRKTVCTDDR